jgi:GntR family transcriptional regulator
MRTVEANDPRTPSVQIADDLRARIESGEFALGAKLPSIRELATQYGVAPMTAQGALQRLRDERRVYSSGRGHFVGAGESDDSPSLAERLREVETEVRKLRSRVESLESAQ